MIYYWSPNDGDVDTLAAKFRKAGQLKVTVVGDTVGMTPFETPAQLLNWIELIQRHFSCTFEGTDDDVA